MQHAEGELSGDQGRRRIGAQRHLLHLIELHLLAASRQHRAQRDRAGTADGIDADRLADEIGAFDLGRICRGHQPIGVGETEKANNIGISVGYLVDDERRRPDCSIDVAGQHRPGCGRAGIEVTQLNVGAVFLEEAFLLGDVEDQIGEDRRDAGRADDEFLALRICGVGAGNQSQHGERSKCAKAIATNHAFFSLDMDRCNRMVMCAWRCRTRPCEPRSSACPRRTRAAR